MLCLVLLVFKMRTRSNDGLLSFEKRSTWMIGVLLCTQSSVLKFQAFENTDNDSHMSDFEWHEEKDMSRWLWCFQVAGSSIHVSLSFGKSSLIVQMFCSRIFGAQEL
jgi:hypothetical protein